MIKQKMNSSNHSAITLPQTSVRGIPGAICLSLTRLFLNGPLKQFGLRCSANERFEGSEAYLADRMDQIDEYKLLFNSFTSFNGKTVLDLGCNRGYLLDGFLQEEKFTAIGTDIDEKALRDGRHALGDRIQFIQSTPESIPLPDESVDVIYTIDTVEHLSRPREIFNDAHRILRPGGIFLVHFCPWLGPYGSHLEDIIPFPWPQAFFSMNTLLDVAATVYDSPEYDAAFYYIDPETGGKKPNPFLDKARWDEYLNRMTVRRFRRLIKELPYELIHIEKLGFGGRMFSAARNLKFLASIPVADEYFTKALFCVLRKSGS